MNIKIRTSFFDIQKFNLSVDEYALVMRNADNQIILPIQDLTAVQMHAMGNDSVAITFLAPDKSILGFIKDLSTAGELAKTLRCYGINCVFEPSPIE